MKKLFFIVSLGVFMMLFFLNCKNEKQKEENQPSVQTTEEDTVWIDTYEGTIPCADCPGIKVNLKLNWTIDSGGENTYTLTEEYIDRDTIISSGKFNPERGFKNDNNATIIVLNWDKPEKNQRYYVWFSNEPEILHVLSPKKELIERAGLNYTLEKVE